MRCDEVRAVLRTNQERLLSEHGVKSLALFGSVARDEAGENIDVDLLVEFDRRISLFDLVGAARQIAKLLNLPEDRVDLVIRDAVLPELQEAIYGEAIDVFREEQMEASDPTHS